MEPSEQRLQKARDEIALLSLMGMLLIPVVLSLFLAESRIDPRAMALAIVGAGFFLPVLAVKGFLRDRLWLAAPFAGIASCASAWIATWQGWFAALALLCGAAGAVLHDRIRADKTYRPRLRGE